MKRGGVRQHKLHAGCPIRRRSNTLRCAGLAGLRACVLLAFAAPALAQVTAPGAPEGLEGVAGDLKVTLNWKEPESDGGAPITDYEYRYKSMGNSYPPWIAVPGADLLIGAGLDAYLIQPNLMNGTEYTFQVRAVNSQGGGTPSDEATATPQPNIPSTYAAAPIKRVPRVPAMVGMELGTFDDDDGWSLAEDRDPRYTFQWQWIRVTGGRETEIRGAVASGATNPDDYMLTPADVGSQLKVRVHFLDDRSNQEEWVSPLFPSSGTILPAATCPAPTYTGGATRIWSQQITVDSWEFEGDIRYGYIRESILSPYKIAAIYRPSTGSLADKLIFSLNNPPELALTETDKNQLTLYVCDEAYPLIDATFQATTNNYEWPSTADWSDLVTRTFYLSRDDVAPTVTGARISGTALVITFSEDLDEGSIPDISAFTVSGAANLAAGSTAVISGDTVTLTLDAAPPAGSTVTVNYVQPGTDRLRDPAQNEVANFTVIVRRPSPPPPPRRRPPPPPPFEPEGYLENPGTASSQSGIGLISGWVCEAEAVEIEIATARGTTVRQEAAYGTERLDTAAECGDTDNGFGLLFNWNLLGDGKHTVIIRVNDVELSRATVTVTTLGQEFLRDVTGTCEAADFPMLDETVTLVWQQSRQNFVLVDGTAPRGESRAGVPGVGYLENPGPNAFQSGIGVLSGWVCAADEVEVAIGDTGRQLAAYGTARADTEDVCGDTDNGFGLLFNWNLLGDGEHEVVAYMDGEELGRATVRVTTLGVEFLRGVEGECTVEDFPALGQTVTLEWQQNSQNFVITAVE